MRKIAAHYMISGGKKFKNPLITLDDKGTITSIETDVENLDSLDRVEFFSGALIPGMVNSHCHLEYSYVKGMIPRGGGLPKFISSIIGIKITDPTTDEEKSRAAKVQDTKMYSDGVTAVADHNNNDYVYSVKEESKIYYHSLVELYDVDDQSADKTFCDGIERQNQHKKLSLAASVNPHATYTMEDDLVALCGGSKSAQNGEKATGPLSIHFKESIEMAGAEEADRVFAALSPERDSIMLIHSIYASKEDIERAISLYGDKLTVVTCPLSNLYIENNITDIELLRSKGVRIAIGTDSLSSNDLLSMVDEIKCLSERYPNIALEEIIEWATINGAQSIGIDSWAGTLEVGKRPGIVNLTGLDLESFKLTENYKTTRLI